MDCTDCRCRVDKKVYLVYFTNNLFFRVDTVDNLQTVGIKKQYPKPAQERRKQNISYCIF